MTLSADYTLTAKNAAGNTVKTESEYPIVLPATKAYNAGAGTAKATGVTVGAAGEAGLNPDDQKYYANASITATSAGVRADGTEVTGASWSRTVSVDVSTPYENGKTAGRNAVTISAAQMLATDSSNYGTYDLNANVNSPYISGDYAYSRITVSANNGESKVVRIRTPDRYSVGELAGKTIEKNAIYASYLGLKRSSYNSGSATTPSTTGGTAALPTYNSAGKINQYIHTIIKDADSTVTTAETQVTIDVSSLLESKSGTNKITSNGTVSLPSGKIGFSSIEVDVPTGGGSGYQSYSVTRDFTRQIILDDNTYQVPLKLYGLMQGSVIATDITDKLATTSLLIDESELPGGGGGGKSEYGYCVVKLEYSTSGGAYLTVTINGTNYMNYEYLLTGNNKAFYFTQV